ncbi:MAG: hypothetical protein QM755_19085 [Luteolibacter sp.]
MIRKHPRASKQPAGGRCAARAPGQDEFRLSMKIGSRFSPRENMIPSATIVPRSPSATGSIPLNSD